MPPISMKQELFAAAREKGFETMPKVLFAASEYAPLIKTGEMAAVVAALPKYLRRLGFDARVMIPFFPAIRDAWAEKAEFLFSFSIYPGGREKPARVYRLELEKICVWLIENEEYFGQSLSQPDTEAYAFFTRAVLEALPRLDFIPDIIHCNDWYAGMLPLLLKTQYIDSSLSRTKSLLTIHNLSRQGLCPFAFVQDYLSVPDSCIGFMNRFGQASFLKAGCVMADKVCTVSPSYAEEICTPEYGEGLERELALRGVCGIVNGIDHAVWDCARDPHLPVRFSRGRLLGKLQCKTALLEELGLEIVPNRPLVTMVTRLTEQKGLELVTAALDELLDNSDFAFAIMGVGDETYARWFRALQSRRPGRVCAKIGFDEALSHRLYAGSDFLLMPSRFEPCGMSQLVAMTYGTVPIVRETGGLRDTVEPWNGENGTGFTFSDFTPEAMGDAIRRALAVYHDKSAMETLIKNAMAVDAGCQHWAAVYGKLYLDML